MANTIRYISLENLKAYTALVNEQIAAGDSVAIKAVKINGETIEFYDQIDTDGVDPVYEVEIPRTDFTEINKKINTLIGTDTDKTVRLIAAEEMARQLIPENASDDYDTLEEIAALIQELPNGLADAESTIDEIKTFIGTLPSDTSATTVVKYIQDVVSREANQRIEADTALNMAVGTIQKDYLKKSDKEALEAEIEANTAALTSKADQTAIDAVKTDLSNLSDVVDTKASKEDLDAANLDVYNNTAAIETINKTLLTKADQTALDKANSTMTENFTRTNANVTANADAIATKASQDDLDTANINIASLRTVVNTNTNNITGNTADISDLKSRVSTAENEIEMNSNNIATLQVDVEDMQADVTAAKESTTTNATNITNLAARVTGNETNIETIQEDLTTLIGSDSGKSARTIASEELAKELIPDNAKDALDTIAEIAQWIQDHPDDASAMNEAIKALQTKVSTDETTLNSTIKNITISGTTITVTFVDGSTKTLTTQDTNTTYNNASTSAAGLMSAADKVKLDGIATGATKITVDVALSSTSSNPVENKAVNTAIAVKADKATTLSGYGIIDAYTQSEVNKNTVKSLAISGKTITVTMGDGTTKTLTTQDTTYSAATTSSSGLMSASDKTKLDGIATGADKTTVDQSYSATSRNAQSGVAVAEALESAKGDPNVLPTLWGKEYEGNRETTLTRDTNGLVTKAVSTSDTGDSESTFTYTDGEINKIVTTTKYGMGKATKTTEYTRSNGEITNIKETYSKDSSYGITWADIAAQVKSGAAQTLYSVGDMFTDDWTYNNNGSETTYDAPWRIADFQTIETEDGSTINGMQLLFEYLPPCSMPFHRPEAFYACPDGLSAGTYNYTYGSTTYQFTLTQDVEAGGRLAYLSSTSSASTSTIVSYKADGKTVIESVSRSTGSEGTALGTIQNYARNGNFNGQYLAQYGSGRYKESHVRQWLNSSAGPNEWWTPSTEWDIVPYSSYYNKAGFLYGLPQDLIDAIIPAKVIIYPATIFGSDPDIVYDKITMPSLNQMYIVPQNANEGDVLQYYKDLNGTSTKYQQYSTYSALKKYYINNHQSSYYYWTRSVYASYANFAWSVGSNGRVDYSRSCDDACPAGLANIGHL